MVSLEPRISILQNTALTPPDLVPIPIPEQPPAPEPFAAALALPSWLAAPVKISQTTNVAFSDLLDTQLAKRMTSKGFSKALPVQAGVLPLLLPTPQQHPGDLCISAATGSGKTLAYVLPMVESLKAQRSRHLRALIVVPTRELVAQVRETAEMCSVGTSLRVGTAIGHHAFKSEQDMLVKRGQAYDQDGHEALRRKAESVDDSEMLETDYVEEFYDLLPFHVPEYTSNVDILICTPGRLVDHIKSTKGFTLQHLEWFVVDEADRLLDQSFQEWVEVLQTAMVSEPSEPQPGQSFRPLFLAPHLGLRPYGWVRKVVLSATLTRDLQKLSSLNLRNPKLVLVEGAVVESTEADVVKDSASGNFTLPSTLQEFGVPVGDGSEKPLYLLKLLRQIFDDGLIGKRITPKTQTEDVASDDNDDNSSTASSESSSDSSLSSDDDDDSDNDSDTSISSDSTSDSNSTISSTTSSSSSGASSTTSIALNPLSPPAVPDSKTNPSLTPSTQHNVLIFTSSTESATRLLHLLTHLHAPYKTQTTLLTKSSQKLPRHLLSSTQTPSTQSQASHTRSQAHGHIIISTDRASRGLDIPSLSAVINYDVPHSITSYIHRVGRTARAGRSGSAWTLVAEREARWFWNVIGKGTGSTAKGEGIRGMEGSEGIERPQGGGVKRVRVVVEEGERVGYVEALEALREEVERGRGGR